MKNAMDVTDAFVADRSCRSLLHKSFIMRRKWCLCAALYGWEFSAYELTKKGLA